MRPHLFLCLLIFCQTAVLAQSARQVILTPADNGRILTDVLIEAEKAQGIDFIYGRELSAYTITGITQLTRLTDFLDSYLVHHAVVKINDNVTFIIDKKVTQRFVLRKENFLLFRGEENTGVELKGTVVDGATSDPLIGAKVYLPKTKKTTATDVDGQFDLGTVELNVIEVELEYVGYEPNFYIIGFSPFGSETELSASLFAQSRELESVTITADRIDENVKARVTGVENLSIRTLKAMPAFMGELDPIRSLTTLPGVSTAGELASGFNVRGGESGQNLVTQDGAVIYNPSHLFGFFSAFNPDIVNNVTLYKGGGPANFGSRIASVLDVSLRNGDVSRHKVSGGIGVVSSRLTVEGPVLKNRSSYVVGARYSYADWLVHSTDNISLRNSSANFHDVTARIFHTFNENNFLTLSGYHSYDDFMLATDSVFSWKTTNFALKWDHTFNESTFSTVTLTTSNYNSAVNSISEIEGFVYENSIRNTSAKFELHRTIADQSKLLSGFEVNATELDPGTLIPDDEYGNVNAENMQNQRSVESAVFLQWEKDLTEKWSLSAGVRYSYFLRLGKEEIYTFDYGRMNGRYPSIADTVYYSGGEVIQRYSGIEPRISARFMIRKNTSIKASYYRGFQYMHLISNTSSTTPQDYWITSGPRLRPQAGDQYSLGIFHNMSDNLYEVSAEGFYKQIHDAVDYIEGADITLNPALEAGLSQGEGLAYGVEVLLRKTSGRASGWLSYTWSRSLRRFTARSTDIVINDGKYYPSAFDQPHHVSLVMNYQVGARGALSANFNYSTGRPITIPVSKFSYDVYLSVLNYSERHDYRIPDYHRLDISYTLRDKPRNNKRFRSEWVFSVFNVYSRKNAYSVAFSRYGTASKISVLGSIFPSVTYNFRF